jgi:hypothetical protein
MPAASDFWRLEAQQPNCGTALKVALDKPDHFRAANLANQD